MTIYLKPSTIIKTCYSETLSKCPIYNHVNMKWILALRITNKWATSVYSDNSFPGSDNQCTVT